MCGIIFNSLIEFQDMRNKKVKVEKMKNQKLKIKKVTLNVYQIEMGKRAVVIKALNISEALKLACKYLSINCNQHFIKA
jgi:hypothetical protein